MARPTVDYGGARHRLDGKNDEANVHYGRARLDGKKLGGQHLS
jgi:hypothetical protein